MKRILLFAAAGITGFLIFLVVFAPAAAAWALIRGDVEAQAPGMRISNVNGTIWSGSAQVDVRNMPPTSLLWRNVDISILDNTVAAAVQLSGIHHDIQTQLVGEANVLRLASTSGTINADYINALGEPYGLTLTGTISIEQLDLDTNFRWVNALNSGLYWSGGNVRYTTYNQTQLFTFPRLDISVRLEGDDIQVLVTHAGEEVINVSVTPAGLARINVRARLFLVANLPWPGNQPPDESVIEIEQPLW